MAATLVSAKNAAVFHKKESVVPDLTLPNTDEYFSTMSLPISNDENRKLEEDLHEQRFKLHKCQREITSLDQSMQTMWQHLQNIKSDVDQNQVHTVKICNYFWIWCEIICYMFCAEIVTSKRSCIGDGKSNDQPVKVGFVQTSKRSKSQREFVQRHLWETWQMSSNNANKFQLHRTCEIHICNDRNYWNVKRRRSKKYISMRVKVEKISKQNLQKSSRLTTKTLTYKKIWSSRNI